MDLLAKEAGVSKGTLYYHFPSKKALFLELVDHWTHHIAQSLQVSISEGKNPWEKLSLFLKRYAEEQSQHPEVFRHELEFLYLSQRDPDFKEKVKKVYGGTLALLEAFIPGDPQKKESFAFTFLSLLASSHLAYLLNGKGVDLKKILHSLFSMIKEVR